MDSTYFRISPQNLKNQGEKQICLMGKVETFSDDKIVLDCGTMKIQVISKEISKCKLTQNSIIEVFGTRISDNVVLFNNLNTVNNNFDLKKYYRAIDLMIHSLDSYKEMIN